LSAENPNEIDGNVGKMYTDKKKKIKIKIKKFGTFEKDLIA